MATLTETAYYTRRTINWAILAVILYIILRITWGIFVVVWLYFFPPKPTPPNFRFGKLTAIKFPEPIASPSGQVTFRLETIEGTVPAASEAATVYFMPKPAANLLAITKTQEFAKRLGLNPKPIEETKAIYRFEDDTTALRRLRYDIVSNNFILRYGFDQDTGLFTERSLPSVDAAIAEAKSMMQTFTLYGQDLTKGTNKVSFLKLVGDTLVPTTSLSQADAVRVDFFRQNVGGLKLFTPYPDEGQVVFIFSGSKNSKKKVLQFAYTLWPIDYETSGTYALKTSAVAWEELKSGRGYIARYPTNAATNIVIRQVYLGYYDSFDPQMYLQPVFVFEGDNGFLAYVPAIVPEWTE
ncbi:hypothetical protein HY087_02035 [Candidatus Gottesmanbacteria bacterium]|nr:hypothetical protein [Candidatus Gottesmanbacteria bacterium]